MASIRKINGANGHAALSVSSRGLRHACSTDCAHEGNEGDKKNGGVSPDQCKQARRQRTQIRAASDIHRWAGFFSWGDSMSSSG